MAFNVYYKTIRNKQKREAMLWSLLFLVLYFTSGYLAEFNLVKIYEGLPNFLDYIRDIVPTLHWPVLFSDVKTEGSLAYWGYRLPIQLPLIWETLNIALAATLISAIISVFLAFIAAKNSPTAKWIKFAVRVTVAFMRTMPELAFALMFVMAFGIGPFAGFLALTLHAIGSLTKLFYEAIETASDKPVKGLQATGANGISRLRFGIWPQIKPLITAYTFMRFEVNFRQSTILGIVGAGGIGQELMLSIKLDRYDQVSITLLMIVLVVTLIDSISGYLRQKIVDGNALEYHSKSTALPVTAK